MNIYFELVKIILPAIITGVVTYWVTMYNHRSNSIVEISYNRIYYPLYQLLKEEKTYEEIIQDANCRIRKYKKYISRTTIKAVQLLEENLNSKKAKYYFDLLQDDVNHYNTKYRRILGYPEPLLIKGFIYLSLRDKVSVIFYLLSGGSLLSFYGFGVFLKYTKISEVIGWILSASIFGVIVCGVLKVAFKFGDWGLIIKEKIADFFKRN